jgi:hypothetical protein
MNLKGVFLLFSALLFLTTSTKAQQQKFKISGKVFASDDKQPIESATVYLLSIKDSTLLAYSISDVDGSFSLQEFSSAKKARLKISFIGFDEVDKIIDLSPKNQLNPIYLKESTDMLGAIELSDVKAPVKVKNDTLEFNVESFKTKQDATVEDLLKKLPGVEVSKDGKILVNGKEVKEIKVNGKSFFGNDPTIATRNLTKEMIDKIQVTDSKTKSEALTGEKGDKESKTINLTIKEDKNKGQFGRVHAGAGNNKRYETAALVNLFNNDRQLSFLFGQNNTNTPGFNFGEISKMYGNARSMTTFSNGSFKMNGMQFGGSDGISVSRNMGVNYVDKFGEKVDISASYFNSNVHTDRQTNRKQSYTIPNIAPYYKNSETEGESLNDFHTLRTEFDFNIDTTFMINYQPIFSYGRNENKSEFTYSTLDSARAITNLSKGKNVTEAENKRMSNELTVTKKYGSKGGFFRIRYDNYFSDDESTQNNNSTITIGTNSEIRDLRVEDSQNTNNHSPNFRFRYPIISKKLFLDLGINTNFKTEKNKKSTFRNTGNSMEDSLDINLSSDFKYSTTLTKPYIELVYRKKGFYASAEIAYSQINQKNDDFLRENVSFNQDFDALNYGLYFWKRFNKKFSTYAGNYSYLQTPSLNQVQSFRDLSDPTNIRVGNPDLEPTLRNESYLGGRFNNNESGWNGNMYTRYAHYSNPIVSDIKINDDLTREITYRNADNTYELYLHGRISKKLRIDSLSNIQVGTSINYRDRNIKSYTNDQLTESVISTITPRVWMEYSWDDKISIQPFADYSFRKNKLSSIPVNNQLTAGVNTSWKITKRISWENTLEYSKFISDIGEFNNSFVQWNSSVSYSAFSDKGIFKLKGFDLLNQRSNLDQRFGDNFFEETQSLILRQYFLVSFTWKFNSMGGKADEGAGFHQF